MIASFVLAAAVVASPVPAPSSTARLTQVSEPREAVALLNDALSLIPDRAAFADTARAGLWEVTGVVLMKLNDIRGATDALGRFEVDYSNPAYPRPDFDAVYNLARLAVQVGDQGNSHQKTFLSGGSL